MLNDGIKSKNDTYKLKSTRERERESTRERERENERE